MEVRPLGIIKETARVARWGTGMAVDITRQLGYTAAASMGKLESTRQDTYDQILARTDQVLKDRETLWNMRSGFVAHEIEVGWGGIAVARKDLARDAAKAKLPSPKYGAPNERLTEEEKAVLQSMPRAHVVHVASVVARGLVPRPDIFYRTTTVDLDNFIDMALDVCPDESPQSLGLEPAHVDALYKAMMLRAPE